MDIDFTKYDPNDSGDYEELMEIIADNPGEEYDWARLADYGIEYAWMQFVWGWDDEPAETPRMTTREFTYSNR